MRHRLISIFVLLASLLTATPCFAQSGFPDGTKYVKAELLVDKKEIPFTPLAAQSAARIGVRFVIEPGWHIYWQNSGEAAVPTEVRWKLTEGLEAGSLKWPSPYRFIERGDITTFGYRNEVVLASELRWSGNAAPPVGDMVRVSAIVRFLVCKDVCVPGKATLTKKVPISLDTLGTSSTDASFFDRFADSVPHSAPFSSSSLGGLHAAPELHFQSGTFEAGSKTHAVVLLPGYRADSSAEVAAKLQLFPASSESYEIGEPEAALLSKEAGEPGGTLVRIPIQISADAKPQAHPVRLVVVLAEPSNSMGALAYTLDGSLAVAAQAEPGQGSVAETLLPLAEDFSKLQFRRIQHVEHEEGEPASEEASTTSSVSWLTLLYGMFSALLGGMLLNLMPCVLPIISIKVMGFLSAANQEPAEARNSAFAFAAGILFSFLLLAFIVIALKSFGFQIGWGFQFQYPGFVATLAFVVFVLGLGFFDLYTISVPYLQSANRIVGNLHPSLFKHFFDGILATALSTPCTAPFLGAALVLAFSQSAGVTILLFLCVGLGLALPYAYLTTHPKLLQRLPSPGSWMNRVRQLMGFFLFATVLWLLWVLHRLTDEGVISTLLGMLILYFAFWLKAWTKESASKKTQSIFTILSFGACVIYLALFYPGTLRARSQSTAPEQGAIAWQPYSAELASELRGQGSAVFIDFTADWCITCKANEYLVIETTEVASAMDSSGIVPLQADWTSGSEDITRALKQYGGEGVPLYVLLPPSSGAEPIVFPSLLTKGHLINAFKQVKFTQQ